MKKSIKPPSFKLIPYPVTYRRPRTKVGRNDPCPCESGKKYKACCLSKSKIDPAIRSKGPRTLNQFRMIRKAS